MSKNKLLSSYLDFVRFFAALLVVFGHAKLHAFGQGKVGDPIVFVTSAFPHLAVIIFFVISGYLVGGKLYSAGKEGFGPKYLLDRATRIYTVALPMMVIGFAIMLIQQYLYGHAFQLTGSDCRATAADLAGSMLFIHGAFMPTPCFNGPFWSLIYEVFYYLFFFAVALALSTHGRTRYIAAAAAVVLGLYGLFEPQELYAYSTIWLVGMVIAHPEPLRGRQLVFTATVIFLFVLQALLRLHDPEMKWEVPATLLMVGSILLLRRWQPFDLPPLGSADLRAGRCHVLFALSCTRPRDEPLARCRSRQFRHSSILWRFHPRRIRRWRGLLVAVRAAHHGHTTCT